ncbi:MAG TPA: L-fucose:H+ symporter permease [Candidatus Sulfotelmatobacter sp.]|nr:L-fucose:H+ symporter permease [Candidatus Sulfotelmatobacter sp.]
MSSSAPITERRYVVPLVLVTSLFFLWAIGVNINDILIQHFRKAFGLTDFQSSWIQAAFFGGYFLAALPAGWLMQRLGYKRGILIGLLVCATGAALFIPAASIRVYAFFLFALFVMACGQSVLEVAANPYVTTLGPEQSSERRLNLAQSFNATGAVLVALLGSRFILSGIEHTPAEIGAMTPAQLTAYRVSEANMVKTPYLFISGLFLFVAVLIFLTKLPEIRETSLDRADPSRPRLSGTVAFPHLIKGVLAQFLYVGAQVGVASFIIRFIEFTLPGTHEKVAAHYLQLHLAGFMIGRFSGSAIMKKVAAPRLLSVFAAGSLLSLLVVLFAAGTAPAWAIVLIGFFHSIMFPTIFALSIKSLGPYTKLGSSLLVMSIIGGAACPAIMGRISDAWNIQHAFIIPLICHAYVFYFAVWGYRPAATTDAAPTLPIPATEVE